jgi:predicted methyltransferase
MRPYLLAALISVTALAGGAVAAPASQVSPAVAAALADAGRPAADKAQDVHRHPAEVLAFAGVKPGQKIADLMMGGGYFTRIFAKAVGPNGKVYAWTPEEFIRFKASYGEGLKAVAADYPNVVPLSTPFTGVAFPETLDLAFTAQNYHDLHLKMSGPDTAAKVNAVVFKALKPGGVYLIIDHVGAPDAADAPDKVHRINPAIIRNEVEAAGFKFDGELNVLRAQGDDLSKSVFDPAVRGKTDQVVYRFRKPR